MSYINVHIGVVVFYLFFVCDMFFSFFLHFSYTYCVFRGFLSFFRAKEKPSKTQCLQGFYLMEPFVGLEPTTC